jgi:hypothetical protein
MSAMTAEIRHENDIEAAVDAVDAAVAAPTKEPVRYLSRTGVATYRGMAGLHSLTGVQLPDPDVLIGDPKDWSRAHKGWLPETIDEWQENRPGKGNWGQRTSADPDAVLPT